MHKLNLAGEPTISWRGRVVTHDEHEVMLEATFTRGPIELGYVTLKPGDRFVERFYADRWYSVYAIYDGEKGEFKGWYCNIARPAEIRAGPDGGLEVRSVDLALDYFVQPSGRGFVLDKAEFAALPLPPADVAAARAALAELQALAAARAGPFDAE